MGEIESPSLLKKSIPPRLSGIKKHDSESEASVLSTEHHCGSLAEGETQKKHKVIYEILFNKVKLTSHTACISFHSLH